MNKPELLAPVGRYDALKPVVEGGADAVYLGTKNFNMRAMRPGYNFSLEELTEAIPWIHSQGVKVYVTLNNLIDSEEIPAAASLLEFLQSQKVDGVIVQDLGIINLANRITPNLPLHASTQMNIHNTLGAKALEEWGIKRVVLSRELSLEEISLIKQETNLQLEFFVFGSRCSSYSGQCYLSSSLGRGNGNQGRCSKPCRLLYQFNEQWDYFLSPKDSCLLTYLPQLVQSGISSLKIEGRMENKDVLKEVVSTFRFALDNLPDLSFLREKEKRLEELLDRSFTPGYLQGKPGKSYFQLKEEEKTNIYPAFLEPAKGKLDFSGWLKGLPNSNPGKRSLAVWNSDIEGMKASWEADIFYLGGEHWHSWGKKADSWTAYKEIIKLARIEGKKVYWVLPSITKDGEIRELEKLLDQLLVNGDELDGLLVTNLGVLSLAKRMTSLPICLEPQLNIFNQEGIKLLSDYQVERICLHSETEYQLDQWREYAKEVLVWGHYPGLTSENCLLADYSSCSGSCQKTRGFLRTENGRVLQIEVDNNCRSHVFPKGRLNLIRSIPDMKKLGIDVFRIDGRGMKPKRLEKIVELCQKKMREEEIV